MYLMRYKKPFCLSYDRDSDSLPHYYVYLAALFMAVIIHKSFNPLDFTWSFSIWLEAFAILPQLFMITRLKDVENITAHYILFLGLYRIFYVFHWYACIFMQDFPLGEHTLDIIPGRRGAVNSVRRFHLLLHEIEPQRQNNRVPSLMASTSSIMYIAILLSNHFINYPYIMLSYTHIINK